MCYYSVLTVEPSLQVDIKSLPQSYMGKPLSMGGGSYSSPPPPLSTMGLRLPQINFPHPSIKIELIYEIDAKNFTVGGDLKILGEGVKISKDGPQNFRFHECHSSSPLLRPTAYVGPKYFIRIFIKGSSRT